ncbi:hypothetical protein [Streptantibioticus ferralitis]|uniref:DUF4913 domain-containing protein n=1 Tax=Streptantibioticus ferralitis TaxID=236510 RepID=A0ABT5Z3W0_9ACTN|nr:hypothetical protein [Streptantibioticus ferralitis]MDF2258517.1 hypothetical protein [Streptantibioticus ferralitis]
MSAEQLEELVRQFALRVKREQHEVEEVLGEVLQRLSALEQGQARQGGTEAAAAAPAGDDPAMPSPWSYRATEKDWRDLAGWVDWISTHYAPQLNLRIWPCWPSHGGVVEELAALHAAWRAAALADAESQSVSPDMAYWHQMWLWPTLDRIRQNYMFKSCETDHTPDRAGRPTDPTVLENRIAAAPARDKGKMST